MGLKHHVNYRLMCGMRDCITNINITINMKRTYKWIIKSKQF